MELSKYNQLLGNNITSVYHKADDNLAKKINKEAKVIATNLKIEDRVETYPDRMTFIHHTKRSQKQFH